MTTELYDAYWRFAAERQTIFFRRILSLERPWTQDDVLSRYKFTNAYRASDRVSQYLIRHVIYRADLPTTPREIVFRILLFKLFNRIQTWELLEKTFGSITLRDFDFPKCDAVLSRAREAGQRLYSSAYIMPPRRDSRTSAKHTDHLELVERMMRDELPERLTDASTMQEAFVLFRAYPTIGDFLAYQLVTDMNYGEFTDFSEMEFVVPGPGAREGLRKCFSDFGGLKEPDLIRMVADLQEREFERLGIAFASLWGRRLQLIDCQNLFCEIDKYARVAFPDVQGRAGRTRIKHRFTPSTMELALFYPPKWKLNDRIPKGATSEAAVPLGVAEQFGGMRAPISLGTYQRSALETDQTRDDEHGVVVGMLGLAGEAGQLLSEYKKRLRDGDTHLQFRSRVAEELGDLLWYLASVARKFGLGLDEVAARNLRKIQERWVAPLERRLCFDDEAPEGERLPRRFEVELLETQEGKRRRVRVAIEGVRVGDELTDNAYDEDGYRFHDVFHFAYAAVLGWSPITRSLLRRKRRSWPAVDEVEDGGRAAVIEEGIAALVFDYARRHSMLEGVERLDYNLLRTIRDMTSHLEVQRCTTGEWEHAILRGFDVWRDVFRGLGGRVAVDLEGRDILYLGKCGGGK